MGSVQAILVRVLMISNPKHTSRLLPVKPSRWTATDSTGSHDGGSVNEHRRRQHGIHERMVRACRCSRWSARHQRDRITYGDPESEVAGSL